MKRAIAQREHPYYPKDWLSKQQTEQILQAHGISHASCTIGYCRYHGISLGGHDSELYIYKISLDQFLERRKRERLDHDIVYQSELIEACRKDIIAYRAETQCVENLRIIHYRLQKQLNLSLEELRPFYNEASRALQEAENADW